MPAEQAPAELSKSNPWRSTRAAPLRVAPPPAVPPPKLETLSQEEDETFASEADVDFEVSPNSAGAADSRLEDSIESLRSPRGPHVLSSLTSGISLSSSTSSDAGVDFIRRFEEVAREYGFYGDAISSFSMWKDTAMEPPPFDAASLMFPYEHHSFVVPEEASLSPESASLPWGFLPAPLFGSVAAADVGHVAIANPKRSSDSVTSSDHGMLHADESLVHASDDEHATVVDASQANITVAAITSPSAVAPVPEVQHSPDLGAKLAVAHVDAVHEPISVVAEAVVVPVLPDPAMRAVDVIQSAVVSEAPLVSEQVTISAVHPQEHSVDVDVDVLHSSSVPVDVFVSLPTSPQLAPAVHSPHVELGELYAPTASGLPVLPAHQSMDDALAMSGSLNVSSSSSSASSPSLSLSPELGHPSAVVAAASFVWDVQSSADTMDPSMFPLPSFQHDVLSQLTEAAAESRADVHGSFPSSDAFIAVASPSRAADVPTEHDMSDAITSRMIIRDDVTLAFAAAVSIEPSADVEGAPTEAPQPRLPARSFPVLSIASSEVCIWLRDPALETEVGACPSPASMLGSARIEASDGAGEHSDFSSHHSTEGTVSKGEPDDMIRAGMTGSFLSQPAEPALPQFSEHLPSFDSVHRQMMDDVTNLSMRQRVLSDPIKQLGYGIEARFGFTLRQLHVPGRLGTEDFMLASELTEDPVFLSLCAAAIDATLPPTIFR